MEKNDELFSRILYKKNVIEDFSNFIRQNYASKKVLCVLSYESRKKYLPLITNVLNKYGCAYKCFVVNEKENNNIGIIKELDICYRNYNFIVGVGEEQVCNLVKLYATKNNIMSCMLLMVPSSFNYFNCKSYICGDNKFNNLDVKPISNFYIDEQDIRNLDGIQFKSCLNYLCSLSSIIIEQYVVSQIYEQSINVFEELFSKYNEFQREMQFQSNYEEKNLKLMDFLIDFSAILNKIPSDSLCDFFSGNISASINIPREQSYIFANAVITKIYKCFFDLKKIQKFTINNPVQWLSYSYGQFNLGTGLIYDVNFYKKINSIKNSASVLAGALRHKSIQMNRTNTNEKQIEFILKKSILQAKGVLLPNFIYESGILQI